MNVSSESSAENPSNGDLSKLYFARQHESVSLKIGALTDIGNKRKQNQDHYAVIRRRRSQEVILSDLPPDDFRGKKKSPIS